MTEHKAYRTPNGILHYEPLDCTDDYPNLEHYDQGGGHTVIVLQRSAMKALWQAQVDYARHVGWSPMRLKQNPKGRPILVLPGSYRTCETQTALWRQDPHRYASPSVTGHTRGIALDIDQSQPNLDLVNRCLDRADWKRARPDESWHRSWFLTI